MLKSKQSPISGTPVSFISPLSFSGSTSVNAVQDLSKQKDDLLLKIKNQKKRNRELKREIEY